MQKVNSNKTMTSHTDNKKISHIFRKKCCQSVLHISITTYHFRLVYRVQNTGSLYIISQPSLFLIA